MDNRFIESDYESVQNILQYQKRLEDCLEYFVDTSQIDIPQDPIERVIFQSRAKEAIRKVAQNRGHVLMVGKPGTGKSMLANMFNNVIDKSMGKYLRPQKMIVAYPGKDKNHIRIAYEKPEVIDKWLNKLHAKLNLAKINEKKFSLKEQINSIHKARNILFAVAVCSLIIGIFVPIAFVITSLAGIGSIFMFMQENNHLAQEVIQQENLKGQQNNIKYIMDMIPEVLYDPRKHTNLMTRVSGPNTQNMKGGFRHDPYQSGILHTPSHKRAYLGAHATAPIIYIDELKVLIKAGYMTSLLEIMQNKEYVLEGGKQMGSGAADKSENSLKAENILVACCNHDTLQHLQNEGDGAFLSRIEDKGEIIQMESYVPENQENIRQIAQFIKQEIVNLGKQFHEVWGEVIEEEGYEGVRRCCMQIFGRELPDNYRLQEREFSRSAVLEIIKELRSRGSDGKLSSILRPINGVIKVAELEAILDNSTLVEAKHVQKALKEHMSLEGILSKDSIQYKKKLKLYINTMTDEIGYVVGLAVITSRTSGQMFGLPLPIHCQISAGGADTVIATGKIGDIAKAASQNVRASIKKTFQKLGMQYLNHEMHVEYIQAHGGVEGDSASVAIDIGLISDYIKQPVHQKYGVTGSLTGDIVLAVGGVAEKVRSIMDISLGMEGVCIPWQNRGDIEPLTINKECEYCQIDNIHGIKIFRKTGKQHPFSIFFCKTKYNAYRIMMDLTQEELEKRMMERSRKDLQLLNQGKNRE